jgi:hypothetical protein
MLVYLGFALNRFLRVPPGWTVLFAIGFTALVGVAMHVKCWDGGIGFAGSAPADAKLCLNGSVGYLPALGALIIIGMALVERHHRAGPYVVWAAAIFAISIVFRTLDLALCDQVVINGRNVGTHFIWHLLNAVVLFLLLRASLEAGPVAAAPVAAEPEPEAAPEPSAAALAEAKPVTEDSEKAADEAADTPKDEAPEDKEPEGEGEPDDESKDVSEDKTPKAEAPDTEKDEAKDEPVAGKGRGKKKPSFPA